MKYVFLSFIFVNFLHALDLSNIQINEYIFPFENLKGQNKEIQKQLNLCKKNDKFKSLEYVSQWLRTNDLNNITYLFDVPVNVNIKSCNNTSWGYNFQAINNQIHTLLTKIAEIYDESSQRVDVLDIGCGNAWLAPFILMAGGNYKGVEQLTELAHEANAYIWKTKHLWTNAQEKSSDLYKIARTDFFNKNARFRKSTYKIIICNNILHFYKPEQIEEIFKLISELLDKDGYLFLQTDAPRTKELQNLYSYLESKNKKYPGFIIENMSSVITLYNINNELYRSNSKFEFPVEFTGPVAIEYNQSYDMKEAKYKSGYIDKKGDIQEEYNFSSKRFAVLELKNLQLINGFGEKIYTLSYCMRHIFTTETLTEILQEKGFIIDDAYYFDEFNNKCDEIGFRTIVVAKKQ